MKRMAASVEMQQLTETDLAPELVCEGLDRLPNGVMVYAIEGPFFFGAVENFERALAQTHTDPRILVIRLRRVPFIDITGLQSLEEAIEDMKKRRIAIVLCEANERVHARLAKAGILQMIGKQNYFHSLAKALNQCRSIAEDSTHNMVPSKEVAALPN
jgi:SulP family sulfate permease